MAEKLLCLILILIHVSAWPAKTRVTDVAAGNDSANPAPGPSSCELAYSQHHCREFKDTLDPESQKDVINCSDNANYEDPIREYLKNDKSYGCLHGILDGTIPNIMEIPDSIKSWVKNFSLCSNNEDSKRMLLKRVWNTYSDPDTPENMVKRWTCGAISREARARALMFDQAIADKQLLIRREFESAGKALEKEELERELIKRLSSTERTYREENTPTQMLGLLAEKYGKIWHCFNPYAKFRRLCQTATLGADVIHAGVKGLGALGKSGLKPAATREIGTHAPPPAEIPATSSRMGLTQASHTAEIAETQPLATNSALNFADDIKPDLRNALNEHRTRIDAVANKAGVDLSPMTTQINARGNKPLFDPRANSVFSVAQYEKTGGYAIHPNHGITLLSHETFHGLFETYMKNNSTKWSKTEETIRRANAEKRELEQLQQTLKQRMYDAPTDAVADSIQKKIIEQNLRIKEIDRSMAKEAQVTSLKMGLHELVADMGPTMLLQDRKVMRNAVLSSQKYRERNSNKARSFTSHFGPAKLKAWEETMRKQFAAAGKYDSYDLFSPLRSYLGRGPLKRPMSQAEVERTFPRILEVLQKDFDRRAAELASTGQALDVKQLNLELYRALERVIEP